MDLSLSHFNPYKADQSKMTLIQDVYASEHKL